MEVFKIILTVLEVIASLGLIVVILLQSGNSDGLSGSIAGGAEQLFGKRKSKGYDALLARVTTVCAIIYIVDSLAIVAIFN